jgi:methyl-galactoside transport system substrate-binding protein
MKKLLILCLVCMGLLILSGCSKKTTEIGILLYEENDTFLTELVDQIVARMPKDVNYKIEYASNSQSIQNQQLLDFIEADVDILLINAVDRLAGSTIVEKCEQSKIPVIFFNREPLESDLQNKDNFYYVGANTNNLGIKQANIVSQLFGESDHLNPIYDKNQDGKIQTIILKGQQGHQDAEKRTRYNISRLQELGYEVEILSTRVANWQRGEGYQVMEELYSEFGNQIEVILSNNDDMALGAIDYLLEEEIFTVNVNNYTQPMVVLGVDGTKAGLEAIEKGLMYGTVMNDSVNQSQAISELIEYLLDLKEKSELSYALEHDHYIYIDGEIILKEE